MKIPFEHRITVCLLICGLVATGSAAASSSASSASSSAPSTTSGDDDINSAYTSNIATVVNANKRPPFTSGYSSSYPSLSPLSSTTSLSSLSTDSFKQLLEQLIQNRLNTLSSSPDLNSNVPALLNAFASTYSDGSYYKRTDTSPGWNKLQGSWGKRQNGADLVTNMPILALRPNSLGQPTWSALIDQREPVRRSGSWNHLNALWGRKRSASSNSDASTWSSVDDTLADDTWPEINRLSIRSPTSNSNGDWNSLNYMWGRRRRRGWNDLQGGWGKRSPTNSNWNQLNAMWGKRAV